MCDVKKSIFIFILIVVAVFIFQHGSLTNVPMPSQYTTAGTSMRVPVVLAPPHSSAEFWSLAKRNDQTYVVNVFNNLKVAHSFTAGKLMPSDGSGSSYATNGQILFDRIRYTATQIHVDPSGKSGYIVFAPANGAS